MKYIALLLTLCISALSAAAIGDTAMDALMDRICPGMSRRISVEIARPDSTRASDSFSIMALNGMPHIKATDRVSAAKGLNHYMNHYLNRQTTWDCMTITLPDSLPMPVRPVTYSTAQTLRYYLNYCTHSYSMPFWDRQRWQQEIDWMALHGINAALTITGTDAVWKATLDRLGYPADKTAAFIAAPAYQAWWLMNNLEGEGTPMTEAQLERQVELQRFIMAAMRGLDIEPVLPGYSGMVPHDSASELGLDVKSPGKWCGYERPAFLLPTDTAFHRIAGVYYNEQKRLYGTARFYSMDPFHEGGDTDGVDLAAAARSIASAMHAASPAARWLIQGWQENPRREILEAIDGETLTVLDLHAETAPQWSSRGHSGHPWVWCMLLNFGGNAGLHGKMQHIVTEFHQALSSDNPPSGIGLTMEGIENNPVMYELICDLPWADTTVNADRWLSRYIHARYGQPCAAADSAWAILANSIYGAPGYNRQQGTTESVFCARPSDHPTDVSAWAAAEPYYDGHDVIRAANLMLMAADSLSNNPHFIHDLTDITRQALSEAGRMEARRFGLAADSDNKEAYIRSATRFLQLIAMQDSLLATNTHFSVGPWIAMARASAATPATADLMERDARTLLSTWGSREASENGRLHDYAHREWAGMLRDLYAPRWAAWFSHRITHWDTPGVPQPDFYSMDRDWATRTGGYPPIATGNSVAAARKAMTLANAVADIPF